MGKIELMREKLTATKMGTLFTSREEFLAKKLTFHKTDPKIGHMLFLILLFVKFDHTKTWVLSRLHYKKTRDTLSRLCFTG